MKYGPDGNTLVPEPDDVVWLDPDTFFLHYESLTEGWVERGWMSPMTHSYNALLPYAEDTDVLLEQEAWCRPVKRR